MNVWNFSGCIFDDTFVIDTVSELHINNTNQKSGALLKYDQIYLFVRWQLYPHGKYVTCSMAILTNIVVMVTLIKCWKFWKYSTGLLMLTLACIDIIGNMIQMMVLLSLFHVSLDLRKLMPLTVYMSMTLPGISNFIMMLISLNIYALVCKPFSHFSITSKKSTTKQIVAISITILFLNIYHFINFFFSNYRYDVLE